MKSTAYQTMAFLTTDDVQRNPAINAKSSDVNNNDSRSCAKLSGEKYSLRQRQKRSTVNTAATATAVVVAAAAAAAGSTTDSFSQSKRLPMKKSSTLIDSVSSDASFDHKDTNSCADGGDGKEYVPRSAAAAAASSTTTTTTRSSRSKEPKTKTKAAPLSKYRRKTANARERTRMREINSAFENLRHCVPHTITGDVSSSSSNEKLTKITTLRLAMKYIKVLSEALANPTFEAEFLLECKNDGDHRFTTFNWTQAMLEPRSLEMTMGGEEMDGGRDDDTDEEDDNLSDVTVTVPVPPQKPAATVQSKKKSKSRKATAAATTTTTTKTSGKVAGINVRKAPTKRQRTKQKLNDIISPYSSSSSSSCSSTSSTSAYASMSSSAEASPPSNPAYFIGSGAMYGDASNNHNNNNSSNTNTCQSMTDLSNFGLLESDGESLPSCLSPLHHSYNLAGSVGFTTATHLTAAFETTNGNGSDHRHQSSTTTMPSLDDNPLELSLRLLESSDGGDSLDFSSGDHQPTTCISPLVTLDSFNPFADLLHSEFSEHNALDLFLT